MPWIAYIISLALLLGFYFIYDYFVTKKDRKRYEVPTAIKNTYTKTLAQ